ncbi:MAG: QVPTGV class sortase B protein-sorting domain-containing protein [Oscillospiraceae bacterium]|nr:QVPTGV class sortase B protein-sorting domain-containing protein [Oscillospiraceae bacterium]
MNKKLARIMSISLALILCMVLAVPTLALGGSSGVSTSIKVPVYLIMDKDAHVPQTTINYTVTSATPPDVASDEFVISAGIMDGVAGATGSVQFIDDQETNVSGENLPGGSTDKKYAETEIEVDFSAVEFTEPGVYRYAITESAPEAGLPAGVTLADPATKYIDVYVERADDAVDTLTIQGVFLINSNDTIKANGSTGSDAGQFAKGSGFENLYGTYDLTIGKNVSGNQASRNKYFQVTVTIIGGANTDSYDVVVNSEYETNPETISVNAGAGAAVFWLKHGETITVQGLPSGAQYMVSENPDGYTATYGVTVDGESAVAAGTSGSTYINNDGLNGNTVVTFDNNRAGTVPTGILLTVAPFAVLMLVGIVGAALIIKKKSKSM